MTNKLNPQNNQPSQTCSPSQPLKIIKHAFSYREPKEFAISSDKPSRTKQSFKDECDINNIMSRYAVTGVIDYVNKHAGTFEDVTHINFENAMHTVANARSAFLDLPAVVRDRFDNDPTNMLEFLENPAYRDEAVQLGIVAKRAETPLPAASQDSPVPTPPPTIKTS